MNRLYPAGLSLVFASCLTPVLVHADNMPVRGPIPFTTFDKDGNGVVSEQEFNTAREERLKKMAEAAPSFADLDSNHDGQLTADELAAGRKTRMEEFYKKNAGMRMHMPSYADFDLDGDGKITEKEFTEAHNKRMDERTKQGYMMKKYGMHSFSDIDTDGNGEISEQEFATHQEQCRMRRGK
ncbi:MAG: EF-hand domain-containing protein [Gammaproteobacteria bacterium]|nr:EF-hand domain-containing protein [Gammaproteobacteria bacterium]